MSVGTRADRGGTTFSCTRSAGRQQRTKAKRKKRKNYYVKQSQYASGLPIPGEKGWDAHLRSTDAVSGYNIPIAKDTGSINRLPRSIPIDTA
jgi:hypothetical protein